MTALAPAALTIARESYERIFEDERRNGYPDVDTLESQMGHKLSRERLEDAARVLACPLKVNPPCWQHGRVLYAVARRYLEWGEGGVYKLLDVGTAKGFSALCMQWALEDSGAEGSVVSVDVIEPKARQLRNTVAELDGPLTLYETLAPWPEAKRIKFYGGGSAAYLGSFRNRVHFAFVDGKHSLDGVRRDIDLIYRRQEPGDTVVFDDMQIPGVWRAVTEARDKYSLTEVTASEARHYAVGVRR